MNKETFEKLMDMLEASQRDALFYHLMSLNDEDLRILFGRNNPLFGYVSKEGFCLQCSLITANDNRKVVEADIEEGRIRLTPNGELIRVPMRQEIDDVDQIIDELGL